MNDRSKSHKHYSKIFLISVIITLSSSCMTERLTKDYEIYLYSPNMDFINEVVVEDNKVTIEGYDLRLLDNNKIEKEYSVEFPRKAEMNYNNTKKWRLSIAERNQYKFNNVLDHNETIVVSGLPSGASVPIFKVFTLASEERVIILAAGNSKIGPKSFLVLLYLKKQPFNGVIKV